MQVDVTGEKAARPAERDMRLQRMIEILAGDDVQMIGDARAQRIRQFHLLARNRDLHHASPPTPKGGLPPDPCRRASTSASSDRTSSAASAPTSARMRYRTASALWLAPLVPGIAVVKKYLS